MANRRFLKYQGASYPGRGKKIITSLTGLQTVNNFKTDFQVKVFLCTVKPVILLTWIDS